MIRSLFKSLALILLLLSFSCAKETTSETTEFKVDFEKFTLEVKVSEGSMEVILNEQESVIYNDIHIQKWGIFENYFKEYFICTPSNLNKFNLKNNIYKTQLSAGM